MMQPLAGLQVLAVTTNVPGPAAAARLHALGAAVTMLEPPQGNLLTHAAPGWYEEIVRGMDVAAVDLKSDAGRARLEAELVRADLLITASRPSSLARLGLSWERLQRDYPRLCHIAIVGYPPPHEEEPGHDLTYMAKFGLLEPPALPRTLIADLAGAERAASEGLALLLARERGHGAGRRLVALQEGAAAFAAPYRYGITQPGSYLGGALENYRLYPTREGWLAAGLLEPQFFAAFLRETGQEDSSADALAALFLTRSAREWEDWAHARGLPLAAVAGAPNPPQSPGKE